MVLIGSLLYGADDQVAGYVQSRIGASDFGPCVAIGIVGKDGQLTGGVVYHEWRGFDVRCSIAIDRAGFLPWRTLFAYAFERLGCQRMTCVIDKKNKASRRLCEKLGFKMEGVHPGGIDGKRDAVTYGMLKKHCRWLKDKQHDG